MSGTVRAYTILVIESFKRSVIRSAQKLATEHPELGTPHLVLLTTTPQKYQSYVAQGITVIGTNFTPSQLEHALACIAAPVKAVACRGDAYVQYLRKIVPLLPADVPVASERSLHIATNKRLMREAFLSFDPSITPNFVRVHDSSAASIHTVTEKLKFPVMVKPASLASSILIQRCDTAAELTLTLEKIFSRLVAMYAQENRGETPEVIVEEFVDGDFYSIDSYVLQPGEVLHTPLVRYIPAKQLGIDDFFLYKRTTPVQLDSVVVTAAQQAAEKAIAAVGLQYSTVHVEMVRTYSGEWKIIELGPRLGRFRASMYRQAFGIDHAHNDVLVRLGMRPDTTPVYSKYCAAYSIYPEREGILRSVTNLSHVAEHIPNIVYAKDTSTPGRSVLFARNGGHAQYELVFVCDTNRQFEQQSDWFEANVRADVLDNPGTN